MTDARISPEGRFVWHDLMTIDLQTASEFYTRLFGWTIHEVDMGEYGTYSMIRAGATDIGGIVPMEPERGLPSHWISYLTVADVDATVEKAPGLGGMVAAPATDIPGVGRFAVLSDPSGAFFSPFTFAGEPIPEPQGPVAPGTFCWTELQTRDPEGARRFYAEICGWDFTEMDMGEAGPYTVFLRADEHAAGMMRMPPDAQAPPFWLVYVLVENVDAKAAEIEELSGMLYVPPRDVPGVGRFSVAADPLGASIAIFRPAS